MARYALSVNGQTRSVNVEPDTPLLYVLRDTLALNGPKYGCGVAQCGACTVHVAGVATRSCVLSVSVVGKRPVVTLEGTGNAAKPSKLQQAFIDEQAVQCGYCVNGMIMQSEDLLKRNPKPSTEQIRQALAGHLCRCGTHQRIVRAVQRASGQPVTA